jgi:hypothetical protein
VNLFLQIDTDRTVRANNLICAHASFRRNIAVRIRDANVSRVIADHMVGAL